MRAVFTESEKIRIPALKWFGIASAAWLVGVVLVFKLRIGVDHTPTLWILLSALSIAELIIGNLIFKAHGIWRFLSIAAWLPIPAVLAIPFVSQEQNLTLAAVVVAALPASLYLPALYLLQLSKRSIDATKGEQS